MAYFAARPLALRLLRSLAQSSKAAARLLLETGLARFALDELLRPTLRPAADFPQPHLEGAGLQPAGPGAAAAADSAPPGRNRWQLGMYTEALRLWRCFAGHELYLLDLDDAYPGLCRVLEPAAAAPCEVLLSGLQQQGSSAMAAGMADPSALAEELEQVAVAREAYLLAAQLCWQVAHGSGDLVMSASCARGVVQHAAAWLQALPLEHLVNQAAAAGLVSCNCSPVEFMSVRSAQLSAHPALPTLPADAQQSQWPGQSAVVLLGAVAAALHFIGSYWNVQQWHSADEHAAAVKQLQAIGLLPLAGASLGSLLASIRTLVDTVAVPAQKPGLQAMPDSMCAAVCEVAVALARLEAAMLQQAAAAAVVLSSLRTPAVVSMLLATAAHQDPTLWQPWDAAQQQPLLHVARTALASLQGATAAEVPGDSTAMQADLALALLRVLPAGAEADALQALGLALSTQEVSAARAAAEAALSSSDSIAELASGAVPTLPSAGQLAAVGLAGYAACWLGLIPEQHDPGSTAAPQPSQAVAAFVQPPARAAVLRPGGSRLSLPTEWPLLELPQPRAGVAPAGDAATAAEVALVLVLGWEQQGLASLASVAQPSKLKAAVQLVFGEHFTGTQPPVDLSQPCAGGGEIWQQPLPRWCLAGLMQRYCCESRSDASLACPWTANDSKKLAERFACESYGHPLFGAAVALLLRQDVPQAIQVRSGPLY